MTHDRFCDRRQVSLALMACFFATEVEAKTTKVIPPILMAAASLQDVVSSLAATWAKRTGVKPVLTFAGTPDLLRQIKYGAPADLIITADTASMDTLVIDNLVWPGSVTDFARNHLVLIQPAGLSVPLEPTGVPANMFSPAPWLAHPGAIAMADPDSVPAGIYGKAAFTNLGLWPSLAPRVVKTSNVRAALALVARGEARFGVVYATDARVSNKVRVLGAFPPNTQPDIVYPMAWLKAGQSPLAGKLLQFLSTPEAQTILLKAGFELP